MHEEALRLEAFKIAMKLSGDQYDDLEQDLIPLAKIIYKFLKGENK
jgi:hypothetical protein